ncbi:hypothetical protein [Brevundimonas vesicularis]|uniref:hypothetical protein n=1 Tax=Brevundimonas vesicularis TaxID=41276 RepID=UPI0028AA3800|nr:hypothetical protein [Brevundimonas vesicularis]
MNSTAAIFARLNGSLSIIDRLDIFEGRAAIFNDRAPDDFQFSGKAALIIAAPSADIDASTFSETIRDITQDVRLYARDTGSTAAIDALGRDIRDLFHLHASQIEVEDGTCSLATATGPVAAPTTDPSLVGRRVQLRIQLKKDL